MAKRPSGPMVPITDADISNLKFIKDAAKTYEKMSEWTGFSNSALSKWMAGDEFELTWRKSVQAKIEKVRRDLDPKPEPEPELMAASRVPVFSDKHDLFDPYRRARDLAGTLFGETGELEALRLVSDLASRILEG